MTKFLFESKFSGIELMAIIYIGHYFTKHDPGFVNVSVAIATYMLVIFFVLFMRAFLREPA